jgi:hypothetical protein
VRDSFLRGIVILGVALLFVSEGLSAIDALTRGPLIVAWLVVIAAVLAIPSVRRASSL